MFEEMNKFQLRAACRTAGITGASKMTNDGMREALRAKTFQGKLSSFGEHVSPVVDEVSGEEYARAVPTLTDAVPALRRIKVAEEVPAAWMAKHGQRVVNNTPPRNRKCRRHPSWMRTAGRLNRALKRKLPAEQMSKVVAVARKLRENLQRA